LGRHATLLLFTVFIATVPFTAEEEPQQNPQGRAWQILRSGLEEGRAANRAIAVQALSLLPANRTATAFALHALQDKNVGVRAAAAVVLGQQHAVSAIPALKDALNDSEISVVLAAAHSLLILRDQSAYQIYYAVLMGDKKSNLGLVQSQLNRLKDRKQLAPDWN